MKRLNNNELDARIHNFMQRKMQEFPDLEPADTFINNADNGTREQKETFRITNRFGFHWHHTPRTA